MRAHNPKVTGSNPVPATKYSKGLASARPFVFFGLVPDRESLINAFRHAQASSIEVQISYADEGTRR